jgi:NADH-quinone oxidoreductase subunit M
MGGEQGPAGRSREGSGRNRQRAAAVVDKLREAHRAMFENHILSWITLFPLLGMAVIAFLPKDRHNWIRWTAVAATTPPLLWAWQIFSRFDRGTAEMQFVERADWIPAFNIQYFLGIDGVSVLMVLLTALLCFLCIFASWGINKGLKGYFAMFLLLDTGMMGVFCALDFFLFYVFWEVMLLPMYFLIGIWGGPRREYAAIKFFLYTLFGSVLMLLVLLAFYFYSSDPLTGRHTFDLVVLQNQAAHIGPLATQAFRLACWIALYIGFAIKVPVFPFHTWLPDAHVEAPTAISVILAGILLKMGTYGLLRISFPILPDATRYFAAFLALMGVINIVYGALCAMAQKDLKKLVAYSSISHMGFVLLGMASFTPEGLNGAVLQMFNHGTVTAMLFLLVGVIYDRAHHREIDGFGGLITQMPRYAAVTGMAFMAALGLPSMSSFISEAMVFLGAFQTYRVLTICAVSGVVLGASYMLWTYQRMFMGPLREKYKTLPEINGRELFTLLPLAAIVIFVGVYPLPVLDLITTSLNYLNRLIS